MILSSSYWPSTGVALKYLFSTQDFYTIFIWVQIVGFMAFFQLLSFRPLRGSLVTTYKATSRKIESFSLPSRQWHTFGLGGICDLVTLGLAERGFSLRMLSASFLKLT